MSLLHSRPVAAQRVYSKPSTMDRLKSLFSSRSRTVATNPTVPRRTRRTRCKKRAVRQPVRKTGLFHKSRPRRRVGTTRKRTGFWASLRPHHRRRPATVPVRSYRRPHRSHKRSTIGVILAALYLKRKHKHHKQHKKERR
ncbi:hypothetical protein BG011_005770 [Mortierella polycephala]|uniref:Uncharacterized protein n=1 Tax=Mortierella polycephala TaxID=41804 RepID=A0A9P6U0W8_9FUNG|nr:hypothetical protein BG011_005770 [Mortierella polycephala]